MALDLTGLLRGVHKKQPWEDDTAGLGNVGMDPSRFGLTEKTMSEMPVVSDFQGGDIGETLPTWQAHMYGTGQGQQAGGGGLRNLGGATTTAAMFDPEAMLPLSSVPGAGGLTSPTGEMVMANTRPRSVTGLGEGGLGDGEGNLTRFWQEGDRGYIGGGQDLSDYLASTTGQTRPRIVGGQAVGGQGGAADLLDYLKSKKGGGGKKGMQGPAEPGGTIRSGFMEQGPRESGGSIRSGFKTGSEGFGKYQGGGLHAGEADRQVLGDLRSKFQAASGGEDFAAGLAGLGGQGMAPSMIEEPEDFAGSLNKLGGGGGGGATRPRVVGLPSGVGQAPAADVGQARRGISGIYDDYMAQHGMTHGDEKHKGFWNRFKHVLQGAGMGAMLGGQGGVGGILGGAITGAVGGGVRPKYVDSAYNNVFVRPQANQAMQRAAVQQKVEAEQAKSNADIANIYSQIGDRTSAAARGDRETNLKIFDAIQKGDLQRAQILKAEADARYSDARARTAGQTPSGPMDDKAINDFLNERDQNTPEGIAQTYVTGDPQGWQKYAIQDQTIGQAGVDMANATFAKANAGGFVAPEEMARANAIKAAGQKIHLQDAIGQAKVRRAQQIANLRGKLIQITLPGGYKQVVSPLDYFQGGGGQQQQQAPAQPQYDTKGLRFKDDTTSRPRKTGKSIYNTGNVRDLEG